VLLVFFAGPSPAAADDPAQAMAHFRQGRRLYQVSDYRAALDEFKRAFLLREDPVFLFNIAQCHRQLGEKRDALVYYRRYLTGDPAADNRAQVEKLIAELQEALAGERSAPAPEPAPTPLLAPAPAASLVTRAPPPAAPALYGRWWFWAAAGAIVAGAVATTLLLTRQGGNPDCRGISPCGTLQ
jgi:tetratricopeptide (TPR) repeat protein